MKNGVFGGQFLSIHSFIHSVNAEFLLCPGHTLLGRGTRAASMTEASAFLELLVAKYR